MVKKITLLSDDCGINGGQTRTMRKQHYLFIAVLLTTLIAVLLTGCGKDKGSWTLPDGTKYIGERVNGVAQGKGVMIWTDGNRYEGDFKNGVGDGYGKLTMPDGRKYTGQFKNGLPNGRGKQTTTKGIVIGGIYKDGTLIKQIGEAEILVKPEITSPGDQKGSTRDTVKK